jgi:predicted nucleic acid-binding protein
MQWVFDASVTMAWCFDDERTAATDALLMRLATTPATVPQIWPLEVANVLALAVRKGRLTPAKRGQFIALLESAPVHVDAATAGAAFGATLALADAHALTVYDAADLELAKRFALPLATLDADLRTAASRETIALL